jgi:hypothetical protein
METRRCKTAMRLRLSTTLRSSLVSTISKPAFLNILPTSVASFTGLASRGTLL